jgi:ubiquinone/menaquinone biosynthesis C-methylase UbiE
MGKVVIDIGCGERKYPGAIGVDIAPLPTVDLLADANAGLPFADSSVDGVHLNHVLEHLDDLVAAMDEVWRVLKPGGRVYITVPHATSSFMTWRDPTHRRGMNLSTLTYFDNTTFDGALFSYYSKANFRRVYGRLRFAAGGRAGRERPGRSIVARTLTDLLEAVANKSERHQQLCERWWGPWFGVAEAYAVLEAVK